MDNKLAERIRAHTKSVAWRDVEIPEWGEDGKPFIVRMRAPTLDEAAQIAEAVGANGTLSDRVLMIMRHACGSDGQLLWPPDEMEAFNLLRHETDAEVLGRLVLALVRRDNIGAATKN